MKQTSVLIDLVCNLKQFKKGASMSRRRILKVLISCLLVGCFLFGNITCAYASSGNSADSNSYENKTELSEDETQPSDDEVVNSEDSQASDSETQTSDDNQDPLENSTIKPVEETDVNSSKNTETEITEYNIRHTEYTKIENNQYVQKESQNTGQSPKSQSKQAPPSASVSLHGEKTEVFSGEDILLKLSAVNLITKPTMHVQVIIIPPSGMMVSSSEFVQSGAGQYTTTYELEPGQGRDIEVRIESGQVGDFTVEGRVVYYFGNDIKNAEDYTLKLPIKVKDESYSADAIYKSLPGFTFPGLIFLLMTVYILRRK